MKKTLSLVIALILALSLLAVAVSADGLSEIFVGSYNYTDYDSIIITQDNETNKYVYTYDENDKPVKVLEYYNDGTGEVLAGEYVITWKDNVEDVVYYYINNNGVKIKSQHLIYYFNKNGVLDKNLIYCIYDNNEILFQDIEYVYDTNENMVKSVYKEYDDNGSLARKQLSEYTYDQYGNETKSVVTEYGSEGLVIGKTISEYTYDQYGREIKYVNIEYDSEGAITWKYVMEDTYAEDGSLHQVRTYYNADGSISFRETSDYTFNENGSNSLMYYTVSVGDDTTYEKWEYKYDSQGRLTSCDIYRLVGEEYVLDRGDEYTYDADGTEIVREYTIDGGNKVYDYAFKTVYDVNGNVIESTEYNDGDLNEINEKYEYAFDKYGRITKDYHYWADEGSGFICTELVYHSIPEELRISYEPEIIDGANQTIDVSTATTAVFRSEAPIEEFVCVKLDGEVVDSKYYTVTEGSTIITFNKEFLSILKSGQHTLSIVSEYGHADTVFTVTGTNPVTATNPETGDAIPVVVLAAVMAVSLAGAVVCKRFAK